MSSDTVSIPFSRAKCFLLLLVSALLLAGSANWFWNAAHTLSVERRYVTESISFVLIVLCFRIVTFYLRRTFGKGPALVIDTIGIIDSASGVAAGRVPWSEIRGFAVVGRRMQRGLRVYVRNPREYVRRASVLTRWIVGLNAAIFSGAVQIPLFVLKIKDVDLLRVLSDFQAKYGDRKP